MLYMTKRRIMKGGSVYGTSMQFIRTYIDDDDNTYSINFIHPMYGECIIEDTGHNILNRRPFSYNDRTFVYAIRRDNDILFLRSDELYANMLYLIPRRRIIL